MDKMLILVTAALGTDSIAHAINSVSTPDPNFLVQIANAIISAIIAIAAVIHLFKKKPSTTNN